MIGRRKLGPMLATAVVAGNMIGSGVFLLPATLAPVGGISLVGWLFAAVGALVLALLFGRLAQRHPFAGGPASYAHAALGPFAGFQASLWYWLACLIGNVAIATAAAGYLAALVPGGQTPGEIAATTAALIWAITAINLVSPRFVAQIDGLLLIAGLVPLLLIGSAGWLLFDPALYRAEWNPEGRTLLEAVPSSLVLVFWAFTGLESACVAAAVVENPERNVPIATLAGVGLAGLIYISASSVIFGLVPSRELALSSAPFALAAGRALGPIAAPLIAAAAMLKALGTLAGWVLLTAQISQAAAERGFLPRALARLRNGDTPVLGLLLTAVIGTAAVVLTISPTLGEQFGVLIEASTLFALLTYAAACLAAMRGGRSLDVALAVAGAAFCAAVIAGSSNRVLVVAGVGALAIALAWPVVAVRQRARAE
ncbi:MAG TPA: amino acid permease [Myxococcota bacterium]|nr:amino acid permease [Myxococcota bacterium]